MRKDIIITANSKTSRVDLPTSRLGLNGENLQGNIIVKFSDEFVNGNAILEIQRDDEKYYLTMQKENESYYLPILSSLLTKPTTIIMQIRITEGTSITDIPVWKSNKFYLKVEESINAEITIPEEYPEWIDIANAKLNEIDESIQEVDKINIDVEKVGNTSTVSITKKDGTNKLVEILDGEKGEKGEKGDKGDKGDTGATGPKGDKGDDGEQGPQGIQGLKGNNGEDAKINGVNTLTIEAGTNITLDQEGSILTINSTGGGSGGASDYEELENQPKINNITLIGNKSLNDLGIQPSGNYALKSEIPDVSNFITNSVNNLLNYYLKSETYTKQEVNNLIGQIATLQFQVVSTLPQTGDSKYIYLVPSSNPKTQNVKDEYIWANNAWEQIGSTQVDLTGYATESWVNTQISGFLTQSQIQALINTALSDYALESDIPTKTSELTNDSGFITGYAETDPTVPSHVKNITQANITSWNNKSDFSGNYNDLSNKPTIPTVPTNVSAFTNDVGYLTEHQDLTDYVKNTDYATYNIGGVVKISVGDHGLNMDNGTLKGVVKSYEQYNDMSSKGVISKGTLENVITGKNIVSSSDLATVATTGSYDDLSNKPTIPVKDNYTITNNLNNQLQTVGIIEQNVGNIIKYWEGTQSEYNAISSKDNNTIYYITDAEESYVIDNSYVHTDNNYTTTEKNKLSGIASGAEVNVQANWNETNSSSDSYIQNKPTIPTVNNSTITIQMNGSTVDNFTTNASSGKTINLGTVITSHQDISGKLNTSKVKNANSTTAGDVYDVRYINTMIGNVETILTTLTTGSGV